MSNLNRQDWLDTALGQYLLAQEQLLFDAAVADLFGFHALQIGFSEVNLLSNSRIPYLLHADEHADGLKCDVLCESEFLPFETHSLDLVLLPHVLEFSAHPHQALREVERILVPEGYVIITGINPMSLWGFRHLLTKKDDREHVGYPWQGHFFSQTRIKDWLALLGLEFVSTSFHCYNLPYNHAQWLNRLKLLDIIGSKCWPILGGIYFIVAKKRVLGMTLLKPSWKKNTIKTRLVASGTQKDISQKMDSFKQENIEIIQHHNE